MSIGTHDGISTPAYIPEVKSAREDLRVILNHRQALDENSPVLVPANAYESQRSRPLILNRENEEGEKIGREERNEFESEHPLLLYEPPELYSFRRSNTLKKYIFKNSNWDEENFDSDLRTRNHDRALGRLPSFIQPFLEANLDRVVNEVDEAKSPEVGLVSVSSTEGAWRSLNENDYREYFQNIVETAESLPSAAVIPPSPLIGRDSESLMSSLQDANQVMSEIAADHGVSSYFHFYLNQTAIRPNEDKDPAQEAREEVDELVKEGNYAGVALTIWGIEKATDKESGKRARTETLVRNLSRIAREEEIPLIMPRSEWGGELLTDSGVHGFGTLLNGGREYRQTRSGGGPTGSDKYGTTVVSDKEIAKGLPLESEQDDELDIVSYLSENNGLPEVEGIPSEPEYDPSGETVQEKFGTDFQYRVSFSKPRRLAHAEEARKIRKSSKNGKDAPAREFLSDKDNDYLAF